MEKGEIILYQPNETIKLEVRLEEEALLPIEGVFYNGQIFDAYKFATDLINRQNTHWC